ncbi:MAG: membrane protein insertase YidC [Thermoanaerobacteraceae bacterium]|uniref:YidC/Oxa1 family membrane protein insertase n=1 Tax=Thermanaeromonas sp. C210 TaxID=2731925 RepID=UPI00155D45F3|nr:YidC/Oxa1 family membrane protein insertase [Thermanaeromonas sp. C210]MBE3580397.1 membrane protein insertase YidC [Thermoanaerobacteraceae bacterium]GFN23107.1 membrane protein [Thermanaeromonas sp. C210]
MGALVHFLSQSIQFFYNITQSLGVPNYGLAIILFTVAVKILLYPLTYKQLKSMRRMQELQPKVQEIQKRFKNNPEKAQKAILELYQTEKVNPFSGCLPLLVQMPILFALFSALRSFFDPAANPAVNMEHANFLWVPNLGRPDPYFLLPVLVAAATFLQQRVSMVNPQDQSQRTMLIVMPLLIGWMSTQFSAGLALYWVVFSLMGVMEHWLLRRQPGLVKEEVSAK